MHRRIRLLLLVGICLLVVWFAWRVRNILTPFFLAAVIAYLLLPLVRTLEGRKVPRSFSVILVYVIGFVLVGTLVSFVSPFLLAEIDQLVDSLPEQTARLEGMTFGLLNRLRNQPNLPSAFQEGIETVVAQIERSLAQIAEKIISGLMGIFTSVFYIILSPVLAYFIMRDWPLIKDSVLALFPVRHHRGLIALGADINDVLAGFIRGQLLVSLAIGLIIAGGLAILGVRYALVVGLIAGAFEIVPYFGPLIGALPAVLLALLKSPTTALWTLLLFVVVNQLESAILSPKVVGDLVGLHPLTVIFVILAGAELAGIVGMLLAVPLAAVFKVISQYLFGWFVRSQDSS